MRLNFRLKITNLTFFAMVAQTQTLEGVTSLQNDGTHIVMWDLENISLGEAKTVLRQVQIKYCLSNIYVVSDCENSYRAWCFTKVSFTVLLKILVDCYDILDNNFFYYTVKRKKATLRVSAKKGRFNQKVVCVLPSFFAPISDCVEMVVYDTGLEKRGYSFLLGGD
jgi:hypothetical protein